VVDVSEATFREEIVVGRVSSSARMWRPPSRIFAAAWTLVIVTVVCAFLLGWPTIVDWILGIAAALVVYGWPLAPRRSQPIVVTVDPDELVVAQADRSTRVPLTTVRRARVLHPAGQKRNLQGWGLSWGHVGRRVWDLPVDGLGMVRVERDHRGLDVDVASARPEALVEALADAASGATGRGPTTPP
jgi:hypothetical protein